MDKKTITMTFEVAPTSPLVDAYVELGAMLDRTDDGREAEAIRSSGDVLWRAMSEEEKDEARTFLALMDVHSTAASPDLESRDEDSTREDER